MLSFLSMILFGLVVGVVAKLLMPGRDPGGFLITILLGIAGALLGGYLGRAMGFYGPNESAGFLMALLGAILLLVIYRLVVGRRRTDVV
ncbi:MAG: GlsB/YeaQ/YmgE family stress response membrane protein [Acidobacteria bacterium]|nr:GlsB/YeaQ/YmgE family stress response membrane protein [Acidobacteriota bacterium]